MTPQEAARLNALYSRRRKAYRAKHPDRKFELEATAVYVAPPELRPVLPDEART